jgi:hypothetical protein
MRGDVERSLPYRDQPECLFILQRHPNGGVVVFASKDVIGPARIHEESFASTGQRTTVTFSLAVHADTYARALAMLFEQWGGNPFDDRRPELT